MKPSKPTWNIGELRLRLPNMSTADARWIANEVAHRLSSIPAPARDIGMLDLRLPADAHADRHHTAGLIVDSIVRSCR